MKKYITSIALLSLCLVFKAHAQLPSNPWQATTPSPNDGYFGDNVAEAGPSTAPNAPEYQAGETGGEILPVDPWARARDRSNTRTWRGSGQHGKLNYIGEATTYTDASGQEMIAPEANRHNTLVMTEHLRKMGYKIPKSYDENIKNAPKEYKRILEQSYNQVYVNTDPLSNITSGLIDGFEDGTGLDLENLMFNSLNWISTD